MAENIQRLNYQIAPASKRNHLTDAKYIQGGYIAVKDLAELKKLPIVEYNADGTIKKDGVIVQGSMAYAYEENKFYVYETPAMSSIPEWVWKDFGGTGNMYSTSTPTNVEVGGIPVGTTIKDATITEMFNWILHKAVDPVFNSLTCAPDVPNTYEYGTKCTIKNITATYTNGTDREGIVSPIEFIYASDNLGNVLFDDESIAPSGTAMPLASDIDLDGTKNYTITAKIYDSCTPTPHYVTKAISLNFVKYNYYVVSKNAALFADKEKVTDATKRASLKKYDQTKSSGHITVKTENDSYVYFLTPAKVGTLQQYDSGAYINITTNQIGTVSFRLDSDEETDPAKQVYTTYYVCRTNKLNSGSFVFKAN